MFGRGLMIKLNSTSWQTMVDHAKATYPDECCGALLGRKVEGFRAVEVALPLENVHEGPKSERYDLPPRDFMRAESLADEKGLKLVGFYHSHPDHEAYFSEIALKNSCPRYSYVVLSIRTGKFNGAKRFLPN